MSTTNPAYGASTLPPYKAIQESTERYSGLPNSSAGLKFARILGQASTTSKLCAQPIVGCFSIPKKLAISYH
nr:hypothetical protein [uncultured Pseudomonas sp.]